jgi:hypothetical protein
MKIIINLGREILLLGSVRESIMTPSETSSEKKFFLLFYRIHVRLILIINFFMKIGQFKFSSCKVFQLFCGLFKRKEI